MCGKHHNVKIYIIYKLSASLDDFPILVGLGNFIFLIHQASNDVINGYNWERWQGSRMFLSVRYQPRFLRKSLATNITNVGPYPGMRQQMLFMRILSSESSTAYLARERSCTSVYPHVFLQRVVTTKSLAANLTNSPFLLLVE